METVLQGTLFTAGLALLMVGATKCNDAGGFRPPGAVIVIVGGILGLAGMVRHYISDWRSSDAQHPFVAFLVTTTVTTTIAVLCTHAFF